MLVTKLQLPPLQKDAAMKLLPKRVNLQFVFMAIALTAMAIRLIQLMSDPDFYQVTILEIRYRGSENDLEWIRSRQRPDTAERLEFQKLVIDSLK